MLRLCFAVGFLCAHDFSAGESALSLGVVHRSLPILALVAMLTGCHHTPRFEGTWVLDRVRPDGVKIHSVTTIAPGGKYSTQTSAFTNSVLAFAVKSEGTFEIKDGCLIDTMTKHSEPATPVPSVFRARIIRFDGRELIAYDEENSADVVFRKESK
jgi:hypothetical protein